MEIKRLAQKDTDTLKELILLFASVFEMEKFPLPSENHRRKLLSQENFIAFAALHENSVIGGLTAYELTPYYSEKSEVFIYDVAVSEKFQRKGVGQKLMAELQEYCKRKNIPGFFVAASEEDAHALDFYRATGGNEERVRHFNWSCG